MWACTFRCRVTWLGVLDMKCEGPTLHGSECHCRPDGLGSGVIVRLTRIKEFNLVEWIRTYPTPSLAYQSNDRV
ncbi:hypothetical protein RRG08_031924 [Elysia crispata]|uniref:Uncharacterized protein n=1 Tax=Elysia crispata TaxID=231223 RepID=A0AAE1DZ56_9GAST|nr:hypothetical protein RRG08_031924 [Elysia crispata]